MIEKIIDAALRARFLVIAAVLLLIAVGIGAVRTTPLDAIPDLSDVQVIIFTEFEGQSPQIVEDQVTYPLTTTMLAVPYAKVVRGYSFFGFSFVYILFEDGTDMYWARSRVLEYLNYVSGRLPHGGPGLRTVDGRSEPAGLSRYSCRAPHPVHAAPGGAPAPGGDLVPAGGCGTVLRRRQTASRRPRKPSHGTSASIRTSGSSLASSPA